MNQSIPKTASAQEALFSLSSLQSDRRKYDHERFNFPPDTDVLQCQKFGNYCNG